MSTYNGSMYIREQIESILSQEGVDISLLVRDDGSKDDTVAIVREYSRKYPNVHIDPGKNIGFAMSFMTLIYMAYEMKDYDYFAFADQDDIWLKNKINTAVGLLKSCKDTSKPNLCWGNALAVDSDLNPLFQCANNNPYVSKPTSLLRYFMLGCTMVFNKATVDILYNYRPKNKIIMHDLWLNQTCVFLGEIVFDPIPHILYRQHNNNTAGVGNNWGKRWERFKKSFKTYERRHFRELNAKNLVSAYGEILSKDDLELISIVAYYKSNLSNRLRMLRNKDINMGSKLSDIVIKLRVILGLL